MTRGELAGRLAGALVCALLLGVGARLTMRVIAVLSGLPAEFSPGGTIDVVAFGLLLGLPTGWVFLILRVRWPGRSPGPGLLLGFLLFALLASMPPPSARAALAATPDSGWLTALLFGALFLGFGLALEVAHRVVQARVR